MFWSFFQVDPSGPLATLRKLLLSEKSIASLKKFLTQYWYTVIFIIVGVLILMVTFLLRHRLQYEKIYKTFFLFQLKKC